MLIIILLALVNAGLGQSPKFIDNDLETYIRNGMAKWQVPGLALVIVKDGKIVKMEGFGVRDIDAKLPVDEHTHFFIASNSKLFTGTALANLELQGKLNLNDPVTRYFPDYQLFDSSITKLVSIRDMLTHRIGTKTFQGDFTFWNSSLSRAEIMKRMRLLKPSAVFRQDYGYCNSCFLTAGEIIPKVIGKSWEQYVQDSMLLPLGMTESFAVSNGIQNRSKNIAVPYTTAYTNTLKTVPYDIWDNLGPAASIVSNVNDLSKWLMFQLDSGRLNGQRLMPWQTLQKTRLIYTVTSSVKSSQFPVNFRGYGLGLFGGDYNGKQIFWHTGGAAGMVSNVCFVPEEKLGIAILTNNDNQSFFEALRYQILDAYLGVPNIDRSQMMWPSFAGGMQQQLKEINSWRARLSDSIPAKELLKYAGLYDHPLYGPITIKALKNQLHIQFHGHQNLAATMQYMSNGEWLLEYNNIEYGIFATSFTLNNNKVVSVRIPFNDFVEIDPYTFVKRD